MQSRSSGLLRGQGWARGLAGTLPLWQEKLIFIIYLAALAFSCSTRDLSLWRLGSRASSLSSCGARTLLPRGLWDLSSLTTDQTRVPCIASGFLTTGPPGKSQESPFKNLCGYDRKQHNVVKQLSSKIFLKKKKSIKLGWKNKHDLKKETFEEGLLVMKLGADLMTRVVSKVLRSNYLGTWLHQSVDIILLEKKKYFLYLREFCE